MHTLVVWVLIFIGWVSTTVVSTVAFGLIGFPIPSLVFLGLALRYGLKTEDILEEHAQLDHDGVYDREHHNRWSKKDMDK
jgi:hypothetical protein